MSGRGSPVWLDRIEAPAQLPAVAFVCLTASSIAPLLGLSPTAADRNDRGTRSPAEAERFLGRRALLRHWISGHLGIEPRAVTIQYDEAGRPLVRTPLTHLFCSVSARGAWTALALADDPIGVDIEPIEPGPIAWAVLSPMERAALEACPEARRTEVFLRAWTVKEAYLKALGTGVLSDPAGLEVSVQPDGTRVVDAATRASLATAEIRRLQGGGRVFAAAVVTLPL